MPQTPIDPPVFLRTGAARVLIEGTEWSTREILGSILREEGYDVIACPGPEGTGSRCTLVATGDCDAVVDADVIVHTLRHTDARNREVLVSLKRRYPDTPVVVEVPLPRVEQFREDFADCHVVPYPMTAESLLPAVREALS